MPTSANPGDPLLPTVKAFTRWLDSAGTPEPGGPADAVPPARAEGMDYDAIVVGTGPGGSVAILRLAQAGLKVLALERGRWYTEEPYGVGWTALWMPERGGYGHHQFRFLARTVSLRTPLLGKAVRFPSRLLGHVVAWLGSGVGGGTHVWAKTMVRATPDALRRFPPEVSPEAMERFYFPVVERMLDVAPYPSYPPYSEVGKTRVMQRIGEAMAGAAPGTCTYPLRLAIHFAPPGGRTGEEFANKHGVPRRTYDLSGEALLRGDWQTTATTDSNYLSEALKTGNVTLLPLHEVDRIDVLSDGGEGIGYRVAAQDHSAHAGRRRRRTASFTARTLFLAAGAIGTTEILLRNAQVHRTLTRLGPLLGHRFGTNGDRLGLAITDEPCDPSLGPTNTWAVEFADAQGRPEILIIDGAYPHPFAFLTLSLLDTLGLRSPRIDYALVAVQRWVQKRISGRLARVWPVPLLGMNGAEYKAAGIVRLDWRGRAMVDIDLSACAEADRRMDACMALMARSVSPKRGLFHWLNGLAIRLVPWVYRATRKMETPHNQGGVPMGPDPEEGVADHAGRIYGYRGLVAADGSLLPPSLGRNPTETLMALIERNMTHLLFPHQQRLLWESAARVLDGLPGEDSAILAEAARRLETEKATLAGLDTTGLPARPEGIAWTQMLAGLEEALARAPGLGAERAMATREVLGRFRQFVDAWIAGLTPERLEALGSTGAPCCRCTADREPQVRAGQGRS